jgi:hypothetical protein
VLDVERLAEPDLVFNLQVEGTPEYYANGVRVHNCTRYMVKAIKHAKQRPPGFRFNGETMRAPIPGAVQQTVHLTEGLWS